MQKSVKHSAWPTSEKSIQMINHNYFSQAKNFSVALCIGIKTGSYLCGLLLTFVLINHSQDHSVHNPALQWINQLPNLSQDCIVYGLPGLHAVLNSEFPIMARILNSILSDWFPIMAREPSLPCYLIHSWGKKRRILTIFQWYLCQNEWTNSTHQFQAVSQFLQMLTC